MRGRVGAETTSQRRDAHPSEQVRSPGTPRCGAPARMSLYDLSYGIERYRYASQDSYAQFFASFPQPTIDIGIFSTYTSS